MNWVAFAICVIMYPVMIVIGLMAVFIGFNSDQKDLVLLGMASIAYATWRFGELSRKQP